MEETQVAADKARQFSTGMSLLTIWGNNHFLLALNGLAVNQTTTT